MAFMISLQVEMVWGEPRRFIAKRLVGIILHLFQAIVENCQNGNAGETSNPSCGPQKVAAFQGQGAGWD
jgi:hypothetical protein